MTDLLKNPISIKEIEYQFATSGVYVIKCNKSETYYIGEAKIVVRRIVDHFAQLREKKHHNRNLQAEFIMYGEDEFVVDLLVDMPNAEGSELRVEENRQIQKFKSFGKKLYNVTSVNINLAEPKPSQTTEEKTQREWDDDNTREARESHAERIREIDPTVATCDECGYSGFLMVDLFICDDRDIRCQSCIEQYLDEWNVFSGGNAMPETMKVNSLFWRWQIPTKASPQEHILLATNRFRNIHGYMPTIVYINRQMDLPDEYRQFEIKDNGFVPKGYIDIEIV